MALSPPGRDVRAVAGRNSSPSRSLASAAARAAITNAPTAEYRHHHRVLAPTIDRAVNRPHWTRRSQLARLLEGGAIGRDEYAAGVKLAQWCEAIGRGAKTSCWNGIPIDYGGGRPGAGNEIELAAARQLQAVAADLGREWFGVLEMTVIDDLPWAHIGQALSVTAKTAKTRAIEGLEMLAGWFRQEPAASGRIGPGGDKRRTPSANAEGYVRRAR